MSEFCDMPESAHPGIMPTQSPDPGFLRLIKGYYVPTQRLVKLLEFLVNP